MEKTICLKLTAALVLWFSVVGCGVKGDPLPPDLPPVLGRGEPNFRRATESFQLPDIPVEDNDEEEADKRKGY